MQPKIELVKTRDFGEIINDTFTFISQNWKPLLKSYAIICGFFIVANLVVALLQQNKVISAMQTPITPHTYFTRFSGMFGITYLLSMIFGLLSYTSITLVPLCFIALYKEKGNVAPETEEVWGYFKYYFFKVMGSYLLIGICLVIGFALCLVPGFYLAPIFMLILPVMVMENTGFGYSWSRSFQLIKENWWQTFGAIVVIWIITYAALMIFIIPVTLFSVGTMFIAKSHPSSSGLMLTTIVSALCQVFLILPVITAALCYFNLNEKKEGTGLMDRINKFGSNDPDAGLPKEEY
ncbi:glycerophosphoryl diester phosphodiesterase membrane domain-containing protein [Mucilaginibacter arboris]|uniref:Glycerophosphoryl diester phosphodiesterase membrane domain-containing protein n=1 Tax=Mucilaginibacter arboris TaxID=2682090 RepID=A0A7K1SV90_9SPHI|nr:glycerophosphoryl diester phosphodiesterase membrane domain-containing protein [Mucilaginibacter arboris]MVN21203.1 hypothetical protein [Mucilaginibacter arboris]